MTIDALIASINVSARKGVAKHPVPFALVDLEGIVGDAHASSGHRQVSLLASEAAWRMAHIIGRSIGPGAFGENLTTVGLDLRLVSVGDRILTGGVALEVTQIGKECHGQGCSIFKAAGKCVMPTEGVFCKVLRPGRLRPGLAIERAGCQNGRRPGAMRAAPGWR